MRAIHPADALDDGCGQHARLAQHFQTDARADDVHNRIHGTDFVEVNALRRQAVDFAFRLGDAPKHAQRLLLHPRREFAALNEATNVSEGSTVLTCR